MMTQNPPSCSAMLLNYNHGNHISDVIDAAIKQTRPFDEIVIVDDASTDNSVEVIQKLIANVPHARLVQNPQNMGVINTLNIGMNEAKGDFIYIMSADDHYSRHILEWCLPVLERYPDVAMVAGNARVRNVDTGKDRVFTLPFPQELGTYSRRDLERLATMRALTFFGGASIIRREVMLESGGHLPALKWHADWFLYLLIACRYPFAVIPQEFIRIRQTQEQFSQGSRDWKQQRKVIESFIRILKKDYADVYDFFRNGGLLPTYDLETLPMLLKDKELRHYLTPLLAWRLLTYKPLRVIGRLLPDSLRDSLRALFRI